MIPELLKRRVSAAPDEPFLFSEADKRQFTYKEFEAAVMRTANMLAANGVQKGDVVSLLLPNSVEYVIAYFACWQLGALAGPINSLLKSQEITYVISNSEARALLVNSEFLPVVESVLKDLPTLEAIIRFDNEAQATRGYSSDTRGATKVDLDHEAIIHLHNQAQVNRCKSAKTRKATKVDLEHKTIIIPPPAPPDKPKGCLLT